MSEHPQFLDSPDGNGEPTSPPPPAEVPAPPTPEKPGRPIFPILIGLLFVGLLPIAWMAQDAPAAADPPPSPESRPSEPAAAAPAPPPPAPASADDLKALRDEVEAHVRRLDELHKRLAALPAPPPAPDLKPVEAKIAALDKLPDVVAPLPRRLEELGGRIGSFDQKLESLRSEISSLQGQVKQALRPAAAAPKPDRPAAPATAGLGAAMAPASALFQQAKYADALAAFKRLQMAYPEDARVWYYSALASGFATGQWTEGDAPHWAETGVEREKAGIPASAQIDAAFAGLTQATGKDWLEFYRQRAKK